MITVECGKNLTDIYVPEIFDWVCQQISTETQLPINYVFGTNVNVVNNLMVKDKSVFNKATKYPLVALYMPIRERKNDGYYSTVNVRKIIIAHLTGKDDLPKQRYEKVFKTILYPVYNGLFKYLQRHLSVVGATKQNLKHDKYDFFQEEPISGINDFVDTVQINNLEFKITY